MSALNRKLILVSGKGGVGKTVVSNAIAQFLAETKKKTLWITFEDPLLPSGEKILKNSFLEKLNCDAESAFEEFIELKIGIPMLAKLFVRNRLMSYLAKAGPGIHELVLLGKVWYERKFYDHVVVDMPSTGFGLAMYESTRNYTRLFSGGRVRADAEAMIQTFGSSQEASHLIVSLPEEMPLRESLELDQMMRKIFPDNPCGFILNSSFPDLREFNHDGPSSEWKSPLAKDTDDYLVKRSVVENENVDLWRRENIPFFSLEHTVNAASPDQVIAGLTRQLQALHEKGVV